MTIIQTIARLVKDPPPEHAFEVSESGISYARGTDTGFQAFEPGVIEVSPAADNILRPEAVAAIIRQIAPANGVKKRRHAVLILPDYAARVTVLDFDTFPAVPEEQLPLVKFRIKKTIPFDIESAAVSYYVQPVDVSKPGSKKVEVLAVTMAFDIVARYEALFRAAGFHPGEVTTSSLAALNLYHGDGVSVVAKLSGKVLTVTVLSGGTIKLFRCVTLEGSGDTLDNDEILAVLHPTFAYVEDELASPVKKLFLCGFKNGAPAHLNCETEALRSRLGTPGEFNAGLLGYLEVGRGQ
jgi:type IV pilus assembly protein PilM